MTSWRWWLCSLLFVATTVNYLDRQVLSLTYDEFIKPEFHWSDADYGTITGFFSRPDVTSDTSRITESTAEQSK